MGADDDRMIFFQGSEVIIHFSLLFRIQSRRRLIQNKDLRISDQGLRKSCPLPITLGQIADQPLLHAQKIRRIHNPGDILLPLSPRHSLQLGGKTQILPNGHIRVYRRHLRKIADPPSGFLRFLLQIELIHENCPRCGCQVSCHHVHGRRFSGAVRPEKPVNTPVLRRKVQVADSCVAAITLGQMLNFNHAVSPLVRLCYRDQKLL